MEKQSFSVRRFKMSDVNGIIKLFENVFEGSFSLDWWKWKYISNPAGFYGEEGDIWVAETSDGEIVGHWAVIPEKMKLYSRTVTVAQAVDAATHPEYRGLGIFKSLVKSVCSDVKERYPFIFGFPNELYKGYEKLGWMSFRIVDFLNFLDYDIPLKSYFKNSVKYSLAKTLLKALKARNLFSFDVRYEKSKANNIKIEEITHFSSEINDFWNSLKTNYGIILERDASFLNWRFSKYLGNYRKFVAISSENDKITGYVAIKQTSIRGIPGVLDIVDLQVSPYDEGTLFELIKFVINYAKFEALNVIHCRVPTWHHYAKILRNLGFIPVGRLLDYAIYQPRLIIYPLAKNNHPNLNEWFLTLADTDYA